MIPGFWLPPDIVHDLGLTLVHFLWQGLALAALLQLILPLCRDAAVRHNWALAVLAMMALAPVLTFLLIRHQESIGASRAGVSGGFSGLGALHVPLPFGWIDSLAGFWLAGIVVLSLRALGGWYLVERLWRDDAFAVPEDLLRRCRALQTRLALTRPIIFLQSALVNAPVVIGWFRPIILIPISAVCGLPPQQLDALVLHELAHIRRCDTFTNILLVLAETILFYHPAVWWVCRRVRLEREHACDDFAVALCGDASLYVEALTALKISRATPVLVLAASGGKLKYRVARLLDGPAPSRKISPLAVTGLLLLCVLAALAAAAPDGKDRFAELAAATRHPASPVRITAAIAPQRMAQSENSSPPVQRQSGSRRRGVRKPRLRAVSSVAAALPAIPAVPATQNQAAMDRQASSNPAAPISMAQPAAADSATAASPTAQTVPAGFERIAVSARKWLGDKPETVIHNFVNSYANAATPSVAEIARSNFVICAQTYGLAKPEYEAFVTRRVEEIAKGAGMKVKSGACNYSVEIVFTARPQEFLDKVHQAGARPLGSVPSEAQSAMSYPVQAWYLTATRDRSGQVLLDDDSRFMEPASLAALNTAPAMPVDGFRLTNALTSALAHIFVVVDTGKTQAMALGAVADYVAMVALSQTQGIGACKPMPSITNLISPGCDAALKPAAITDSDLAYLEAVYTVNPGANLRHQQNVIAARMAVALGVK